MHAALLSLVLMSGACTDLPPGQAVVPAQQEYVTASDAAYSPFEVFPQRCNVSVSYPPITPHGCPGCNCGANKVGLPPAYRCCPDYQKSGCTTTPAWLTGYHPAWYLYPNHRMFLDPADYTEPYPYRERFNYPGHDPRCQCAVPPIGY